MNKKNLLLVVGIFVSVIVLLLVFLFVGAILADEGRLYECELKDDGTYCYIDGIPYSKDGDGVLVIPAEHEGTPITEVCIHGAMDWAHAVKEIIVPEGVTKISSYDDNNTAFFVYKNLEKIVLPSTLRSIVPLGRDVEIEFQSNEYLEFSGNCIVEKATNTLLAAGKGYEIPDGVTIINKFACYSVSCKSFSLPSSVNTIGACAFAEAEFDELSIPAGVTVGAGAFMNGKIDTLIISSRNVASNAFASSSIRQLVFDVVPEDTLEFNGNALEFVYDKIGLSRPEDEQMDPDKEVESDRPGYRKYDVR